MSIDLPQFAGLQILDYTVEEALGSGSIGSVYVLRRRSLPDVRAVKFIAASNVRDGWENEITKVSRLRTTDGVVKYQAHGRTTVNAQEFLWISWDYIDGESLKKCIDQ